MWKLIQRGVLATCDNGSNRDRLFASTRWSVVLDAAQSKSSPAAMQALSELCAVYWRPLYLFLRRQGFCAHDAQDLTQGFFAQLIETRLYVRAEPSKGRFRSFLLGTLKHFIADRYDYDHAQKRGGNSIRVPINDLAVQELEAISGRNQNRSADCVYEREWAEALLRRALDRLRQECILAGKAQLFDSLKLHLAGTNGAAIPYEQLSEQLRRPAGTVRSDMARLRARYRTILRDEVRATVEEASQVDEELRYLCQVMAAN